jgi:hypothetical protein
MFLKPHSPSVFDQNNKENNNIQNLEFKFYSLHNNYLIKQPFSNEDLV